MGNYVDFSIAEAEVLSFDFSLDYLVPFLCENKSALRNLGINVSQIFSCSFCHIFFSQLHKHKPLVGQQSDKYMGQQSGK